LILQIIPTRLNTILLLLEPLTCTPQGLPYRKSQASLQRLVPHPVILFKTNKRSPSGGFDMSEAMAVQEHLYDAVGQLADPIDFGIDPKAVRSGGTPIPAEGLRSNWNFTGEYTGPKIKGKLVGVNYSLLRADHVSIGDVQTVLTTPEGDRIAIHSDSISDSPPQSSSVIQWRANVSFHTASSRYSWLNRVMCRETGTIDLATGKAVLKGYKA
jgi:hypothetical protein